MGARKQSEHHPVLRRKPRSDVHQKQKHPQAPQPARAALPPGWRSSPDLLQPRHVLALQRAVGNRAVTRLLGQAGIIQAKLMVGPVNDAYEHEADRVAAQVVGQQPATASDQAAVQRQVFAPIAATITSLAQRQEAPAANGSFEAGAAVEQRLSANKGHGDPLPAETRALMEPRFGADFSEVRVHTSGEAVQLARDLQAQAFTHGQDIYFGAGQYDPGAADGQHLLAHELTHTIQQTGAAGTVQRKGGFLPQAAVLEAQAKSGHKLIGKTTYGKIMQQLRIYEKLHDQDFRGQMDVLWKISSLIDVWEAKHGHYDIPFGAIPRTAEAKRRVVINELKKKVNDEQLKVHNQMWTPERVAAAGIGFKIMQPGEKKKPVTPARVTEALVNSAPPVEAPPTPVASTSVASTSAAAAVAPPTSTPLGPDAFNEANESNVIPEAVGGEMNKLDEITYNFGVNTQGKAPQRVAGGQFTGYFKKQDAVDPLGGQHRAGPKGANIPINNPKFMERNLATYKIDQLLGGNIIPPTFAARHAGQVGTIMEKVIGKTGNKATAAELNHPLVRQGLSKLYLLDVICGQVDRHNKNYMLVIENGTIMGVKGIDNDLSFGQGYSGAMFEGVNAMKNPTIRGMMVAGLMPGELGATLNGIDQPFAVKIVELATSREAEVRAALNGLLSDTEIDATIDRLKALARFLKPLIDSKDGVMKTTWE